MKYFILSCCLLSCAFGQFPNVVLDDVQKGYKPCEPSIAISPHNPDLIVAGSVLNRIYRSEDGGNTWSWKEMTSPLGVFGDPVILASEKHKQFYYFHLANPDNDRNSERFLDRMVCQTSKDEGRTWSSGSSIGLNPPKDQDKEWAAEDPRTGRVYLSWTEFDVYGSEKKSDRSKIRISYTDDRGANWTLAVTISSKTGDCLDDDGTTEGAVPSVGPNGEVYVAWARKNKIYFQASENEGQTWRKREKRIAKQAGGWAQDVPGIYRCNGMPFTACDLSNGPHRGQVYVMWSDQRNGEDDTDIWMIRSDDKGSSWEKPVRVNDDAAGQHQFFPNFTIDPSTGYLYVVFYDRRDATSLETDVYLAYSKDGGKTFQNVKISESSFTPNPGAFFGDYTDISAIDGVIRPIWTAMNPEGRTQIITALISQKALDQK